MDGMRRVCHSLARGNHNQSYGSDGRIYHESKSVQGNLSRMVASNHATVIARFHYRGFAISYEHLVTNGSTPSIFELLRVNQAQVKSACDGALIVLESSFNKLFK